MSAGGLDIQSLLSQLGGAGGAPPGGDPASGPGDPPGGPYGPDPSQQAGGQPIDLLKEIIGLVQQYLQAEPDEEDKLQGTKLLQLAQQLLAKDQQDKDQALGGGNARILRKAG